MRRNNRLHIVFLRLPLVLPAGSHRIVLEDFREMAQSCRLTRRSLIVGSTQAGLLGLCGGFRSALAQITDLRGLDPLWRSADEALQAFFPNARYFYEGISIDLPQHADVGSSVPLTVRLRSRMTDGDFPRVIHVLAHGNPTAHVLSVWLAPACGKAEFSTRIRLERTQTVTAVALMSDGRHVRADREVSVSLGACGQIGTGSNDDISAFEPQSRVNVPTVARRGEIIAVRALISHPMETGMRVDGQDEWVRQRIISSFECQFNGKQLFRARLYPAVATNPYFQFFARAEESGRFSFSWYDIIDKTYVNGAALALEP